jgi:hypothetical protein
MVVHSYSSSPRRRTDTEAKGTNEGEWNDEIISQGNLQLLSHARNINLTAPIFGPQPHRDTHLPPIKNKSLGDTGRLAENAMPAFGHARTCATVQRDVRFTLQADTQGRIRNIRKVPIADMIKGPSRTETTGETKLHVYVHWSVCVTEASPQLLSNLGPHLLS